MRSGVLALLFRDLFQSKSESSSFGGNAVDDVAVSGVAGVAALAIGVTASQASLTGGTNVKVKLAKAGAPAQVTVAIDNTDKVNVPRRISSVLERDHHMRPTPTASPDERTPRTSALLSIRSWLHTAAGVVRNGTYGPRALRAVGHNRPYGPITALTTEATR